MLLFPFFPTGRLIAVLCAAFLLFNLRMTLYFIRVAGLWRTGAYLFFFLCYHLAAAVGIASWLAQTAVRKATALLGAPSLVKQGEP